jgi:hypothetical protein
MSEHEIARTLVKSAPELWEVCSDPDSLARHLQAFGEIRITRVEPESTVAWEGERVSGTVRIEPSGWGTRVTLTATAEETVEVACAPEPEAAVVVAVAEPQVVVDEIEAPVEVPPETAEAPPARRVGLFRRLGRMLFSSMVTPVEMPEEAFAAEVPEPSAEAERPQEPEPEPLLESEAEPEMPAEPQLDAPAALAEALDSLGSDHHRPFSRS